jgi:formylglycine-generating enzyme required for sulfatase activity
VANEFRDKIQLARESRRNMYFRLSIITPLILISLFFIYNYFSSFRVVVSPSSVEDFFIEANGGFAIAIGDRVLAPFGKTEITVRAFGYDLERQIVSKKIINKTLSFRLKLSKMTVDIQPSQLVTNAKWMLGGIIISPGKLTDLKLRPGVYELSFSSDYHFSTDMTFEVRLGEPLRLTVPVTQKMVKYKVDSVPAGASVYIGASRLGETPISDEIAGGEYLLRVEKEGYLLIEDQIDTNQEPQGFSRNYRLENELRSLAVSYSPKSGKVFIDGVPQKLTPVLKINSLGKSRISYEALGYQSQEIQVGPNEGSISFKLKPNFGLLKLDSVPKGKVFVKGTYLGTTPVSLKLLAKRQEISIEADGYVPYVLKTSIAKSAIQKHEAKLQTWRKFRLDNSKSEITNSIGLSLRRFQPEPMVIGAPRKEKGQRANEQLRRVNFTRAIYFSATEITESQYSIFKSGVEKNLNILSTSKFPITGISWNDAATFCNWLSAKENLSPVYLIEGDRVVGFDNTSLGYRLPSEAEWEYVARFANKKSPSIFVWGSRYTVPKNAGNLADLSSASLVKVYLGDYEDNHAKKSTVSSYSAEISKVFDMSGNVSEWVHDFYSLTIPDRDKVYTDYMGEPYGTGHVVKGSSYLSSSWTELRASFRATSNEARGDIGFRVVRLIN